MLKTRQRPAGRPEQQFKVKLDKFPHSAAQLDEGKARIYFIHDAATAGDFTPLVYPTVKVAMDGSWVGGNRGDSFFQVDVTPGEHHICETLQTSIMDPRVELAHFNAEAGRIYFYRTRLLLSGTVEVLELEPIDSDQGAYLVSQYPMSSSKPKK